MSSQKSKFLRENKQAHVEVCAEDELLFLSEYVPLAVEAGWTKTEWESAIKKEATQFKKRKEEEERQRRREEKRAKIEAMKDELPDDVPFFKVGDYAEMAEKLVQILAREAGGEEPAYHADGLWSYDETSKLWVEETHHEISARLQAWSGRAFVESTDPNKGPAPLKVNNVNTPIEFAKALPTRWGRGMFGETSWLSSGERGIGFENLFMAAVRAGDRWDVVERAAGPENRARFGYHFPLDLAGESGKFLEFVDSLFAGAEDKEQRIGVLQEHLGACIMGIAPMFNKALILYGPPGTGKGTLLNIVSQCMPDHPSAIQPKDFDDPQMLATLAKARLNVVNELSYEDMSDANAVKRVVSGDLLTAKEVYQRPFSFRPDAGHLITANVGQLPSVPNADNAFWDRWLCVPMENRFRDTDGEKRGIVESITGADVQGVVSWMIKGAIRLCKNNGYTGCPSGEEVLSAWAGRANSVTAFIEECISEVTETSAANWPKLRDIYNAYTSWAKISGYRSPVSYTTFKDRAESLGRFKVSDGHRFKGSIKSEIRHRIDEEEYPGRGRF